MGKRARIERVICCAGAAAAAATAPLAQAEPLSLTGSIGAATEYVYRGVSQTYGEPAMQAGLLLESRSGWSAGAWGSTTDLDYDGERGYVMDLHATRSWSFSPDVSGALSLVRHEYFRENRFIDYDHSELIASLSLQQRFTFSAAWSPDTTRYLQRGRALAYELTWLQPLNRVWSVFAGAGRYDLDAIGGERYHYWSIGVTFTWAALQIDAIHIGADPQATRGLGAHAQPEDLNLALSLRF